LHQRLTREFLLPGHRHDKFLTFEHDEQLSVVGERGMALFANGSPAV
jgi:hypothetical protein